MNEGCGVQEMMEFKAEMRFLAPIHTRRKVRSQGRRQLAHHVD